MAAVLEKDIYTFFRRAHTKRVRTLPPVSNLCHKCISVIYMCDNSINGTRVSYMCMSYQ